MRGIGVFSFSGLMRGAGRGWERSRTGKARAKTKAKASYKRPRVGHPNDGKGRRYGRRSRVWKAKGEGDGVGAEGNDVVGADHALVAEAEAAGEIEARREGAEVALGLAGGDGEALVVIGAEAGEDVVGGVEIAGLGEAEFADQAVLAGAPGALDAAFGLGRVGGDLLDAEFFQGSSQMGGALFAGELFGQGPVGIVTLEDAVAVTVEAEGHAVSGDHGVQSAEIAERIFSFQLEMSGEDLAGSVILKADEGELGAAAFEPVMAAGVGEHHHTEAGTAQAAGAIAARAALLRGSQLGVTQDAAYALATDHEVHLAAKFLAEDRKSVV